MQKLDDGGDEPPQLYPLFPDDSDEELPEVLELKRQMLRIDLTTRLQLLVTHMHEELTEEAVEAKLQQVRAAVHAAVGGGWQ